MAKYWLSPVPTGCGLCKNPILTEFVDGSLKDGIGWGCFCPTCWKIYGHKELGPGLGQRYQRQEDGKWLKVGG